MIDLKDNEHLTAKLTEIYGNISLPVDKIMNENMRQWAYPEVVLITVMLVKISEQLEELRNTLKKDKAKSINYKDIADKIFVKPKMRAKDISLHLPEGVTIKDLLNNGVIRKVNPFVYEKV